MFSLEQTDVKRATRPFLRGMGVVRETKPYPCLFPCCFACDVLIGGLLLDCAARHAPKVLHCLAAPSRGQD